MRQMVLLLSLFFGSVAALAQNLDTIINKTRAACDRIETFSAEAYVYEYYGCNAGLTKSTGRYSYIKPSTVDFQIERNGAMQPYSRLSSCASDLVTALVVDPLLSSAFIDRWDWSKGTVESQDSTGFVLSAVSNDTMIRCSIDGERFVITSVALFSVGDPQRQLYYAVFSWGMFDDTVPYLEDVKISGYPEFQRGGVHFFDIVVNGKSDIIGHAPARIQYQSSSSIAIRQSGGAFRFDFPLGSTQARLYDFYGRIVYSVQFPLTSDRSYFIWSGSTRKGQAVAAGRYVVVCKGNGFQDSKMFVIKK